MLIVGVFRRARDALAEALSTAPALKPYCGTSGLCVNPACTGKRENGVGVVGTSYK